MVLWGAVVAVNVIGLFAAVKIAVAIRAIPATESMETGLRFAYYGMMVVCGLVDALWIDEVLFKGAFRRGTLQGKSARYARKDEDVEVVASSMMRTTASFPITVLATTVLTYLLFNLANHDFDPYYRHVGKHFAALRGDDPARAEERREAIALLSIRQSPPVVPMLARQLEREGEVAAWSAWAMGRHRDDKNPSRMIPPLVAAYREGDPALQREALLALARLQHRPFADEVQDALAKELEASEKGQPVDRRLLWALAFLQDTSSLELLERAMYHRDPEVARLAAWAIAQHRDQQGGHDAVALLEARLPSAPFPVKCAIVHSLGIMSDEASNLALMHAHDSLSVEDRAKTCPMTRLNVRPDGKDDRFDIFVPQDSFALKTLQSMGQMRATTPEIRDRVEPWLEGLIREESTPPLIRESCESLLAGIREQRDDSAWEPPE
jgi:hypothetical protein